MSEGYALPLEPRQHGQPEGQLPGTYEEVEAEMAGRENWTKMEVLRHLYWKLELYPICGGELLSKLNTWQNTTNKVRRKSYELTDRRWKF